MINLANIDQAICREKPNWNYIDFIKQGQLPPDLKLGVLSIPKVDPFVGEIFTICRDNMLEELEASVDSLSEREIGILAGQIELLDAILHDLEID